MKRVILGVAAAFALTAGQASAEGLLPGSRIASAPMSPEWTGFYLGAGVGAGAMVTDVGVNSGDFQWFGLDGIGSEGVFGTVSVGYDRQLGSRWVLGVFADYDFGSNISTDLTIFNQTASIDQGNTWAVGGRLGFLANPGTLVYGTGGYTETEFGDEDFQGYFAGAGIETMLHSNWSLKLEYRFSQFDEVKYGDKCLNLTVEPSEQTARLVLSYKFGGLHRGGSIKD